MNKLGYKFYPLEHGEWVRACHTLKAAEKDVLYWIRTMDPYSNGLEICISDIAREINRNKSTVSRALKVLDAQGFIDMELVKVKATVTGKGALCGDNPLRTDNTDPIEAVAYTQPVAYTQQESRCVQETVLRTDNECCVQETSDAYTQRSTSETLAESESCNAKNLKEFKDLSLSESATGNSDFSENAEPLEHPLEHPPLEQDEEGLIAFVISQIGRGANNPRAYARAALRNDRDYWEAEFERCKQPPVTPTIGETPQVIAEPFGSEPRPQPAIEVVNDREAILARAAGLLEMGRSPSMANFAQQRLKKLIDEYSITPEELKGYLGQKIGVTENVCEVVHQMEVPHLAGVDVLGEYADRCKAAQWKHFTDLDVEF